MFLEKYLLIQPEPTDDEETRRQKELINHAALTYLRLQTVPQVGNLVLDFLSPKPEPQFAASPTPDSVAARGLMDILTATQGTRKAIGLAKFLGGRGF